MAGYLPIEPYAAFTRQNPRPQARHPFTGLAALAAARALLPLNVSIEDADLWDGQKADADAE